MTGKNGVCVSGGVGGGMEGQSFSGCSQPCCRICMVILMLSMAHTSQVVLVIKITGISRLTGDQFPELLK